MLKAFQNKLEVLSLDPEDNFEKRIRERTGAKVSDSVVDELRGFVKLIPRIQKRIYGLYVWLPENSKVKDLGSHYLAYMYQPNDFIPENEHNGLFGYLDDAYFAALFYELMIDEIRQSKHLRVRKKDMDLLRKLIGLRRKARVVIPDEAIKIKQMLGDLFEQYHKGEKTC